jgi:O-antigen/teichoic acid export membrane protein
VSFKDRLTALSPKKGSLGARAINAGSWNLLTTIASQTLRLISNLIMTRLLMPEAFGMIAMASVVLTALSLFTDIGLGRSIIREKDGDSDHFLRVAWVVKILRGAVVAIGVLIGAGLLWLLGPSLAPEGTIYARPEMPGLIAMAALAPFVSGFGSTTRALTIRRLEYRRFTLLNIGAQILSTLAMVLFAQISPTVWALMAGMLTSSLLQCIFTHLFLPGPRMKFAWDSEILLRVWTFGKWLLGASTLTFVGRNADKLILGGLIGSVTFGIYVIAQFWLGAGKAFVTRLSEGVGFPAVAEVIRTRPKDVPRIFRKFQNVIDTICFSAFAFTFLLGGWLIETLYSTQYHDAGRYLQLMSPGFLIMRFDPLMNLIMNTGNSRAMMMASGIRAVAMCISVPLGFSLFGVEGAILGAVLAPAMAVPYTLSLTHKILGAKQTWFDLLWFGGTLVAAAATLAI